MGGSWANLAAGVDRPGRYVEAHGFLPSMRLISLSKSEMELGTEVAEGDRNVFTCAHGWKLCYDKHDCQSSDEKLPGEERDWLLEVRPADRWTCQARAFRLSVGTLRDSDGPASGHGNVVRRF